MRINWKGYGKKFYGDNAYTGLCLEWYRNSDGTMMYRLYSFRKQKTLLHFTVLS